MTYKKLTSLKKIAIAVVLASAQIAYAESSNSNSGEYSGHDNGLEKVSLIEKKITDLIARSKFSGFDFDDLIYSEEFEDIWYRDLRIGTWVWQGIDLDLIRLTLARIIAKDGRRDPGHFRDEHLNYVDTYAFPNKEGAWTKEWKRAARQKAQESSFAEGDVKERLLRESSILYTIASYPHLRNQEKSNRAFEKAVKKYSAAFETSDAGFIELDIPFQSENKHGNFKGFLHLPENTEGPVPVVIVTGGVDVVLTEHYPLFEDLKPYGMGMLSLDVPGVGVSQNWPTGPDQALFHRATIQYLIENASELNIDPDSIAIVGSSFGANLAIKTALESDNSGVKAVVNRCGAVGSVFARSKETLAFGIPSMTTDATASVLGLRYSEQIPGEPDTFESLRSTLLNISLYEQGFLQKWYDEIDGVFAGPLVNPPRQDIITDIPILSMNVRGDPIGTVEDMDSVSSITSDGETKIWYQYGEEGHCAPRSVSMPYIAWWLSEKLK